MEAAPADSLFEKPRKGHRNETPKRRKPSGFLFLGEQKTLQIVEVDIVNHAATDRQLQRNVARTLSMSFFQVFMLVMPIAVPFFESRGLTMQEVFSLQALFALAVLLGEVPSGYLADLVGRRLTLVIGA